MEKNISINQRIPIYTIEQALRAVLDGTYSYEYALELAKAEFQGANRQKKAATFIGRLTDRNPLLPFLKENQAETMQALAFSADRALIMSALINAAFPFGYDVTWLLGKYFHVQDTVSANLIAGKLAEEYGDNRRLSIGLYAILPMYIEAGLLTRPREGFYSKPMLEPQFPISKVYFKKSFFHNNPLKNPNDDWFDNPYFEFIM